MADRGSATGPARPIWMKQAEEAKQKSEAEKAAAAKAAFEATFKAVNNTSDKAPADDSDSDAEDEPEDVKNKPVGPVDPAKCTAAGAGIAGGTACAPSSFVITTKDSDGRKISNGGAQMKVRILPGVGVGGSDQEGMVKDMDDGTYTVTYAVPKRGNYMVHVECDGRPIMGSPFPVFFSAGTPGAGLLGTPTTSPFPNLVNQTMPNMPNYAGSVSGAFPGLLGMIPGVVNGASGGVILPGVGASLGEVCREYLNGRCSKSDCKFNHPPHNLLMTALAATSTMGTLSQAPMAPSAAAMAAAQAIVAAQALQAHAAQMQAQAQTSGDSSGSPDKAGKADALKKTLQVSNLSPLLTAEQLKQLFSYCGTVVGCTITDSKHFAYIEYSKPEEATAALALNNMDVGGRPLNVEMAKSLPSKTVIGNSLHNSSLPMVMQQAVAMQQMQFQQALLMQQTMASQQAASRAATMKSATEMASARAAEISKKLKADGLVNEDKAGGQKSRSPSMSRPRSKSRSRSPVKYRRSQRSHSFSPPLRYSRGRRSRSPPRSHRRSYICERRSYRDSRDSYSSGGRRFWELERERKWERSRDRYSSVSRRHRSRSKSPQTRRSSRTGSASPKRQRESVSPRRKSSRASSKSPRRHRESRSPPRSHREATSHHSRHSRSNSADGRRFSDDSKDTKKSEKSKVDDVKHDRSGQNVEDSDLFTNDLKDSMEDKSPDSPMPSYKRNLLPEDGTSKDEKDVDKSTLGRHRHDAAKDAKDYENSKLDQKKLYKRREVVEESELVSEEKEDSRDDRTTELPSQVDIKALSLPEDRILKDKQEIKSFTGGGNTYEDAKDNRKCRKLRIDDGKVDKYEGNVEEHDHIVKDSSCAIDKINLTGGDDLQDENMKFEHQKLEENDSARERICLVDSTREHDYLLDDSKYSREDRKGCDSSKLRSQRRISRQSDGRSSRGKDDHRRHKESKREYQEHDKAHTLRKERSHLDYDSSDSREDRRDWSSKQKSHRRISPSVEDGTSRDQMNSSSPKQKANRSSSSLEGGILKARRDRSSSPKQKTHRRNSLSVEDETSKEERDHNSSPKQKIHRRNSPSVEDRTSKDRRDYGTSPKRKSHRRSSPSIKDGASKVLRDRSGSPKWKTHRRMSPSVEDGTSKDQREHSSSPKQKTHRRRSPPVEGGNFKDRRKISSSPKRKSYRRSSPSVEAANFRDQRDHSSSPKRKIHRRSSPLPDTGTSRDRRDRSGSPKRKTYRRSSPSFEGRGTSKDHKDHTRHEILRPEMRKSLRADSASKMEDYDDENLDRSVQDGSVSHSKVSSQKTNSLSEDDLKDMKGRSKGELVGRKLEKTDSICKEKDRINQGSAILTSDMVSESPELLVHKHSLPDDRDSKGARNQRQDNSTIVDRKFVTSWDTKGPVHSGDDSIGSRKDGKLADSTSSKAQQRNSISPKDRSTLGIEEGEPSEKA